MSVQETPQKVSSYVDKILNRLNTEWDLQLPRLHGVAANAAEHTRSPARKCSGRIRYLCFRLDSLDHILDEFAIRARQSQSNWVAKPNQEKGTLPSLPITKFNAHKQEGISIKKLGLITLNNSQRRGLLQILDQVLEPYYTESRARDPPPRSSTGQQYQDRSIKTGHCALDEPAKDSSRQTGGQKRDSSPEFPTSPTKHPKRQLQVTAADSPATNPFSISRSDKATKAAAPQEQALSNPFLQPSSCPPPSQPPAISFDFPAARSLPDIFDAPVGTASTNDTSFLDDDRKDDSQDYFPIQDAREYLEDPFISRSLDILGTPLSSPPPGFLEKVRSTFNPLKSKLPSHLSFDAVYEIQSLALSWGIESISIFKSLEPLCGVSINDPHARWSAIKAISKGRPPHNLTEPSSWSPEEEWKSVCLSATLHWAAASSGDLFKLQMNGPTIDKTCRFYRYLGNARLLTLNVPFLNRKDIPSEHRPGPDDHKAIHAAVLQVLSSEDIVLAGRRWRVFYHDEHRAKNVYHYRFILAALSGVGISKVSTLSQTGEITLQDFLNWHLAWRQNLGSSDLKLFARLKLGLSKTIPTVVLNQEEFLEVDDRRGSDGKTVMNDGCAMMSFELADEIRKILGLAEIPAAFQGRISGAKGVWIVDRWHSMPNTPRKFSLEITPSQLKVKPHSRRREACSLQRTFEVSGWSHCTGPAAINSQFITVLNDRGVSSMVLKLRLEDSFKTYYDELLAARDDPRQLRSWLQTFHHVMRDDDIKLLGALPDNKVEKMHMLLDSGFRPATCTLLHDLIKQEISYYSTLCVEKMRIAIPQSTYVYCLPDLCGVLEEAEIHLGIPSSWSDPVKSISRSCISDCDGLVARNPANLPSDMQRVKFRFHHKLADCRDVAIFSTKGNVPLASLLSGGDYDGDEVWVCWDQDLVTQFENYAPGPPEDIKPEACGLTNRSKPLRSVFPLDIITADRVDKFIEGCLRFNTSYSYLGKCTNTHQQLVYRDSKRRGAKAALQSKGAIHLAALASFLVDASKQGYELSSESWIEMKQKTCGKVPLEFPAYKKTGAEADGCAPNTANVVDFLRFGVAQKEKDRILTDWAKRRPNLSRDEALIQPFDKLWKQTESQGSFSGSSNDSILREILQGLKSEIGKVVDDWRKGTQRGADGGESDAYRRRITAAYEAFTAIQPLEPRDQTAAAHWFYQMVKVVEGNWDLIKASCLYAEYFKLNEKLVFNIAGDKLCEIKARSLGRTRTMTASMSAALKVDSKGLKRHIAAVEDRNDHLIMNSFAEELASASTSFMPNIEASQYY